MTPSGVMRLDRGAVGGLAALAILARVEEYEPVHRPARVDMQIQMAALGARCPATSHRPASAGSRSFRQSPHWKAQRVSPPASVWAQVPLPARVPRSKAPACGAGAGNACSIGGLWLGLKRGQGLRRRCGWRRCRLRWSRVGDGCSASTRGMIPKRENDHHDHVESQQTAECQRPDGER